MQTDVFGCSLEELATALTALGEKSYRAKQIWKWIYQKEMLDLASMTDIAQTSRDKLKDELSFTPLKADKIQVSEDGTAKFLLELGDKNKIETVYIPEGDRGTICVSSQAGCALRCKFCYTGTQGLTRNLTASEIVRQILLVRNYLRTRALPKLAPVTQMQEEYEDEDSSTEVAPRKRSAEGGGLPTVMNIVFMGMGEPLVNYDNVAKSVQILTDADGLNFSRRRITVSTSGITPEIERCAKEMRVNLALSLHATTDELRTQIMPINRKYPLKGVIKACRDYQRLANSKRITFEYVMLDGVNDSPDDARRLAKLVRGIPSIVNMIPFNAWPGSQYKCPSDEAIRAFGQILKDAGQPATVRASRGRDILAACGQLKA